MIIAVQLYFLFLAMFLSIKYLMVVKPVMNDNVVVYSMAPVAMLTLVYVNLKAFLRLQDILVIVIVATLGMAGNEVLCKAVLEAYDFGGGLIVYLFGTVVYVAIRMIGLPVRSYNKNNNSVPITNNMALAGIAFSLVFFPEQAGGFIGGSTTFFCQISSILGYLIVHLNRTNTIRFQRVFELTVSSGVLMSVGGTLFQNLAAPCVIGMALGVAHAFVG